MTRLDYAKKFLQSGIAVIPLRHRGKEPESKMTGGSWDQYRHSQPTEYDLLKWLGSNWQNYGVVCGWNNLAVIDFDEWDAYEIWKSWFDLLNKHGEVYPVPYTVKTARGAHVYVRMPVGGVNQKRRGVDVKFNGFVVGPESIHPSGKVYTAMNDEFCFPEVFSLDTLLPVELFPYVIPDASTSRIEPIEMPLLKKAENAFEQVNLLSGLDLINRIKQTVRIENMLPGQLKRTSGDGRWYSVVCPFHADHKPSMWVDVRRQLCGCEVCRMKPMDAINLYARMKQLSNADAVLQMAEEIGVWR